MNNFFHFLSVVDWEGLEIGPFYCSCGETYSNRYELKQHIRGGQ